MNYKIVLAQTNNLYQTSWPRGPDLPRIAFASAHSHNNDEAHQQIIFDQCQEIFLTSLRNVQRGKKEYVLHDFVPDLVPYSFEKNKFLIMAKMAAAYTEKLDQKIQKFNLLELGAGFSPLVVQEETAKIGGDLVFLFSLDLKWRKNSLLMSFWTHAIRDFLLGKELGKSKMWEEYPIWTQERLEKFIEVLPALCKSDLNWSGEPLGFKNAPNLVFSNHKEHQWLVKNKIL